MRATRIRRTAAAAATALLLAVVAACDGGADTADSPPASASPSPAETKTDPSPQPAGADGEDVDAEGLLEDMKAAVSEHKSAHVTMDMQGGAQGLSGEGDVSYAGKSTAMHMRMKLPQLGDGEMEMRLLDGVIYLSMPPMTPRGKFLKVDTNDPNSPFGDLGGMTAGDPLQSFEAFDAGLKSVEYVGEEEVDGETLRHYALTVDAAKAAEAQGQQVPQGMPKTISYDLWLDDQDLMRRIEFEQMGSVLEMTMSDWGKPVTVKAPRARDLMEMPSTMPSAMPQG